MASFFDKLKTNIGFDNSDKEHDKEHNEERDEERDEEEIKDKEKAHSKKSAEKKTPAKKEKEEEKTSPLITEKDSENKKDGFSAQKWLKSEGQLAVDILETPDSFIIQSTIAGIKSRDLDISVRKDLVTIKGERKNPRHESERNYLCQECYWGPFAREIIMPEEIDESQIKAALKDGILILEMPKKQERKGKKIEIAEE